jgi:endonuclease-8
VSDLHHLVSTAHRLLFANREHPEQSTTGVLARSAGRLGADRRGDVHWVYERGGAPCLRCRTPIERALQGEPPRQRSTYWCPACQPAGDRSPAVNRR